MEAILLKSWGVNETSKFEGIKTFEDGEIDDDVDLVVSDEIECYVTKK